MTPQRDCIDELRAAYTMRLLDNAKRRVQPETGPLGFVMRVTLAVVFLYLIVISYLMLGTMGVAFVSVLALVAYFVPYLHQTLKGLLERRRAQRANRIPAQESTQEG